MSSELGDDDRVAFLVAYGSSILADLVLDALYRNTERWERGNGSVGRYFVVEVSASYHPALNSTFHSELSHLLVKVLGNHRITVGPGDNPRCVERAIMGQGDRIKDDIELQE